MKKSNLKFSCILAVSLCSLLLSGCGKNSNSNDSAISNSNDSVVQNNVSDNSQDTWSTYESAKKAAVIDSGNYYFLNRASEIENDAEIVLLKLNKIDPVQMGGCYYPYEVVIGNLFEGSDGSETVTSPCAAGYAYLKNPETLSLHVTPSDGIKGKVWDNIDFKINSDGTMTYTNSYGTSDVTYNKNILT